MKLVCKKACLFFSVLFVVGLLWENAPATITNDSWYLDLSNNFPDGRNYAQVNVYADDSTGKVDFILTAFTNVYDVTVTEISLWNFAFGYKNITSTPDNWSFDLINSWTLSQNSYNSALYGTLPIWLINLGSTRSNVLTFSFTLPDEDKSEAIASNFAVLSTGGASKNNVYFTATSLVVYTTGVRMDDIGGPAPVPEPATLLFSLVGLVVLKWLKKR